MEVRDSAVVNRARGSMMGRVIPFLLVILTIIASLGLGVGSASATQISSGGDPKDAVYDVANNRAYVLDGRQIKTLDTETRKVINTPISLTGDAVDMVIAPSGKFIYATISDGDGTGHVDEVNLETRTVRTVLSGIADPAGIDINGNGTNIVVAQKGATGTNPRSIVSYATSDFSVYRSQSVADVIGGTTSTVWDVFLHGGFVYAAVQDDTGTPQAPSVAVFLELSSGKFKTVELPNQHGANSIVGSNSSVYIAGTDSVLYSISVGNFTSASRAERSLPASATNLQIGGDGTVYLSSTGASQSGGKYLMVAPTPGAPLTEVQTNASPTYVWPDPKGDSVFVLEGSDLQFYAKSPTGLKATAATEAANLTWVAPDFGATPSGYQVDYRVKSTAGAWTSKKIGNVTSYKATDLTPNKEYEFRVAATIDGKLHSFSNIATATPTEVPKTAPGLPRDVAATGGVNKATVKWTVPESDGGSPVTGYEVQYRSGNGSWSTSATTTKTTLDVSNLDNGKSYQFRVAAKNVIGLGDWAYTSDANRVKVGELPGAPTSVKATAGMSGKMELTWVAPTNNGDPDLTGYVVQYREPNGTWSASQSAATTATTIAGLTNGKKYEFKVAAVNFMGTGAWSAASSATTVGTVPAKVGSLKAVPGDQKLSVSWTAPSATPAVTDYLVEINDGKGWKKVTAGCSGTTCTITGLDNGTKYEVRVTPKNDVGAGEQQSTSATPATKPGEVRNLEAAGAHSQATLTWDAPASDGGDPVKSYLVRYREVNGTWSAPQTVTSTSAVIKNLTDGKTYEFQVAAKNGQGESPWTAVAKPLVVGTVPGTIDNVSVKPGDESLTLTWKEPTSSPAVTGYKVEVNDGKEWKTVSTGCSGTSCTISDLENGKEYDVRVTPENAVGSGTATTASGTPKTVPAAPTDVAATGGDKKATVTWVAPTDNGGAEITHYLVQYKETDGTWSDSIKVNAPAEQANVAPLENGKGYTFRVAAVNSEGQSTWLESSAENPVQVGVLAEAPTSVMGTAGTSGEITVNWNAPVNDGDPDLTDYAVQVKVVDGEWSDSMMVGDASTKMVVGNLTDGKRYFFRVAAKNTVGLGPWGASTDSVVAGTAPKTVDNLTVTPGDGRVVVDWKEPETVPPVTDYTVEVNDGSGWKEVTATCTGTSCTIPGLTNGDKVEVRVTPNNEVGEGEPSTGSATPISDVPGAPGSLSGAASVDKVELEWTAPTGPGAEDVTDYVVEISTDGGKTWDIVDRTGTGTTETVAGLSPDTEYTFRVTAKTEKGVGEPSEPITLSTKSEDDQKSGEVATKIRITSENSVSVNAGAALMFTVTTEGEPTPVISASDLPDWATLVDNGDGTAIITGTPAAADAGKDRVVLRASAEHAQAMQIFMITVVDRIDVPKTLPKSDGSLLGVPEHVMRDQQFTVEARGYLPGSTVNFAMYSSPALLGSAVADANGTAKLKVRVPSDAHFGEHTVMSIGLSPAGEQYVLTAMTTVDKPEVPGKTGNTGLTNTGGVSTGFLAPLGVLVLLVGAGAVLGARRRSQVKHEVPVQH